MLFLLTLLIPLASAGPFPGKKCGDAICLVPETHPVTCNNGVCECNDGYYGDGRFQCVNKTDACVCYLYGDPHVTSFSEAVLAVPLQCRVILAEFTTPTGVYVKVAAQGSEATDRDHPGYIFEDEILFAASKATTTAHADIKRSGFYNKGLYIPLPVHQNFPDIGLTVYGENESHYWRLELPRHKVIIRYRSGDSSLTIQTPRGSTFTGNRPCGNCEDGKDTYLKAAATMELSIEEFAFYKTVLSLDFEKETDETCQAMSTAATSCPQEKLKGALKFCSAPYNSKPIGKCFVRAYGKDAIMAKTVDCINTFCKSDITDYCNEIVKLLAACAINTDKNRKSIDDVCSPLGPPSP